MGFTNIQKIRELSRQSTAIKSYFYIFSILIILTCIWVAVFFTLNVNNPNSLFSYLDINFSVYLASFIGIVLAIVIFLIVYLGLLMNSNFYLLKPFLEGDRKQIKMSIWLIIILLIIGLVILYFNFTIALILPMIFLFVYLILNFVRLKELNVN